jgi:hypothetical protein
VQFLRLYGREQPDLHEVERADEAVTDAEPADADDRVTKRHRPLVLEQASESITRTAPLAWSRSAMISPWKWDD